jgi:hypothetical protein
VAISGGGPVVVASGGEISLSGIDNGPDTVIAVAGGASVSALAMSTSGALVASGNDDGTVTAWDTDPEAVRARVCQSLRTALNPAEWQELAPDVPYRTTCEHDATPADPVAGGGPGASGPRSGSSPNAACKVPPTLSTVVRDGSYVKIKVDAPCPPPQGSKYMVALESGDSRTTEEPSYRFVGWVDDRLSTSFQDINLAQTTGGNRRALYVVECSENAAREPMAFATDSMPCARVSNSIEFPYP